MQSANKRRRAYVKQIAKQASRVGSSGFKRSRRSTAYIAPGRTRTVSAYTRTLRPTIEKKFLDVVVDLGTVLSHNGTVVPSLNLVGSGAGQSQRVGRQITVTNINFHGHVLLTNNPGGIANTPDGAAGRARVIFYLDKQCNGQAALPTDIIRNAGPGSLQGDGFRELDQASRFEILKDKFIDLNALTTFPNGVAEGEVQIGDVVRKVNFSHTCRVPVVFSGNDVSPDITTVMSNNFGILIYSLGVSDVQSFSGVARVKYTDA